MRTKARRAEKCGVVLAGWKGWNHRGRGERGEGGVWFPLGGCRGGWMMSLLGLELSAIASGHGIGSSRAATKKGLGVYHPISDKQGMVKSPSLCDPPPCDPYPPWEEHSTFTTWPWSSRSRCARGWRRGPRTGGGRAPATSGGALHRGALGSPSTRLGRRLVNLSRRRSWRRCLRDAAPPRANGPAPGVAGLHGTAGRHARGHPQETQTGTQAGGGTRWTVGGGGVKTRIVPPHFAASRARKNRKF